MEGIPILAGITEAIITKDLAFLFDCGPNFVACNYVLTGLRLLASLVQCFEFGGAIVP